MRSLSKLQNGNLPVLNIIGGTSAELYFLRKYVKHLSHDFICIKGRLLTGEFVYFYVLTASVSSIDSGLVLNYVRQSGLISYVGQLCGDSLLLQGSNLVCGKYIFWYRYISCLIILYSIILSCYYKRISYIIQFLSKNANIKSIVT